MKPGLLPVTLCLLIAAHTAAQTRWVRVESPTTKALNTMVFLDTLRGWVAGDSGVVIKTTDGGESWILQDTRSLDNIVDITTLNGSLGWALAQRYPLDTNWYGTTLLKTTDGGTTWLHTPYREKFYQSILFFDSLNGLLAGGFGEILKTTDGGASWVPTIIDSSLFSGFPVLNMKFHSRSFGFAIGGRLDLSGVVWRTTNGGERWSASGPGGEPLHGLHYVDSLNVMAIGGDYDFGSGMVVTKDGGRNWEYVYLGIWGEARAISFRTPGEGWAPLGFAATYMVTTDTGRTWFWYLTPDTTGMYDLVFIDSTHGFMVGDRGTILRYDPMIVGVGDERPPVPATTVLHPNFPNPFNPSTVIRFELPERSEVTVTLYDVGGREVRTLQTGEKEAGMHAIRLDAADLASGTYFYQLATATARYRTAQVRKMLLLK